MCKPRYRLVALSLWLMIGSLAAAPTNTYINLGKFQVHPTRILAKYKTTDAVSIKSVPATVTALGLSVTRQFETIPGLVVFDAQPRVALQSVQSLDPQVQADTLVQRIALLENSGLFEYVQPSYVYRTQIVPNDAAFADGTLWGLTNNGSAGGVIGADIQAPDAWSITTGSTNVIVAVVDTGIRYTHRDLAAQMWHNPGETPGNGLDDDNNGYVDDVFGVNAVAQTGDPMDDNGHGTHVSGTIGAAANDGNGMVGVAWNVRLMACKALDSTGVGLTDDLVAGINYAVAKGAKVINASWGGYGYDQAIFDAISAAQKKNVLFIAAAGNDFNDNDVTPFYPAGYPLNNIIAVAAMDRTDNLAFFSNYGATNVDVVAPGVDIFSTWFASDSAYMVEEGTSMAAPHVSGVAALVVSKFTNATLAQLRERIVTTAVKVPAYRSIVSSGGRVNAYRALTAVADGIMEMTIYPPPGNDLLVGSLVDLFVNVTDLQPVTNATVTATYMVGTTTNTLKFLDDGKAPDLVPGDAIYSATLTVPNLSSNTLALNFTITATNKTNLNEIVLYHLATHPPNDNFESATKVPSAGALLMGTNKFATLQLGEPMHANVPAEDASVWWNWSPAANTPVIVDTAGSSFDTVLAVYTNNTLKTLHVVASVDNVGLNGSRKQGYVQFNAVAGLTYHIAVAGVPPQDTGSVRLRVEPNGKPDTNAPVAIITSPVSGLAITNTDAHISIAGIAVDPVPNASGVKAVYVQLNGGLAQQVVGTTNWSSTNLLSQGINTIRVTAADYAGNLSDAAVVSVRYAPVSLPNDLFHFALPLTGTSGTVTGSSTNATKEVGEPFHAGNEGGKSLWWYFQAPADGVLTLSTINSDFDTLLAVYTGTMVNALTPVGSNDDAVPGSGYSRLAQAVQAGVLYHIAVDGYGGASGQVALDYSFAPRGIAQIDTLTPDGGGTITPGSGLYPTGTNLVFTANPDPGQEFDHWEGVSNSTDNPVTFQATGNMQLIAHFRVHQPTEGFESGALGSLPWQTAGNAPWFVESTVVSSGKYAVQSGAIKDGQSSSLILSNMVTAAGTASFDFKVSSEENWDFLEFYLNGKRLARWSGEAGWLTFQFDLVAGTNTMEWRYEKDPVNGSVGADAAYMDNLELPQDTTGGTGLATIQAERLADGSLKLSVHGTVGQFYSIQVSTDLVNWSPLPTAQALSTGASFLDTTTTGQQTRFYRVVSP